MTMTNAQYFITVIQVVVCNTLHGWHPNRTGGEWFIMGVYAMAVIIQDLSLSPKENVFHVPPHNDSSWNSFHLWLLAFLHLLRLLQRRPPAVNVEANRLRGPWGGSLTLNYSGEKIIITISNLLILHIRGWGNKSDGKWERGGEGGREEVSGRR